MAKYTFHPYSYYVFGDSIEYDYYDEEKETSISIQENADDETIISELIKRHCINEKDEEYLYTKRTGNTIYIIDDRFSEKVAYLRKQY